MTHPREAFQARYACVYEGSPWVAEQASERLPSGAPVGEVVAVMAACVEAAPKDRKLALIRAHPDLADRAGVAPSLSDASRTEQTRAGLDRCTPDEFTRFHELNRDYREKFGFPFVIAVRQRTRAEILAAFERRLHNDYVEEFETALREIHEIARLRILALEGE